MTTPPITLPSDSDMLLWAFSSRQRLRKLWASYDWNTATPELIRAALALAMTETGEPRAEDRGRIEDVVTRMQMVVEKDQVVIRGRSDDTEQPARFTPPAIVRAQVPDKFVGVTLDHFDVTISGPEYEQQLTAAKRAALAWVELAAKGKPVCLALVGSPGNGKSTLLWGAVEALFQRSVKCYARPWYRLADELRYGGHTPWKGIGPALDAQVLRGILHSTPVVALDEICPTAGTLFDESELGKLVKNSWDHNQALIVATNVHPLSNLMGDAAADRFTVVQINAPSRRGKR